MTHTPKHSIALSAVPLSINDCITFIKDPTCGAEAIFIGTVRNHNLGKEIISLEFSAYDSMAIREMKKIAKSSLEKFNIAKIAIHHRTGLLHIEDIPVIIAVSSAHRTDAFQACQYAIDTLKQTVPIWKKETSIDGTHWVNAHP